MQIQCQVRNCQFLPQRQRIFLAGGNLISYTFLSKGAIGKKWQKVVYAKSDNVQLVDKRNAVIGIILTPNILLSAAAQAKKPTSSAYNAENTKVVMVDLAQADEQLSKTQKLVLEQNGRVQKQNNVPNDFPQFIRQGFEVVVVADGYNMEDSGLIYKDYVVGTGVLPGDGDEVIFDYQSFNESAKLIDTTYGSSKPAETRLGVGGLIPGFEIGVKGMKVGGKRRIVVPPALGPPTGPGTFFSAKQFEVFDIELRQTKACVRKQVAMFSTLVCE
eukprot:TRINITY_DN7594_c0_g1_i8.p1 TRINITY_DN7594_c0_g1~~TRINITY_DN7594_c0_g1_i8.p1  ORF type:complete len:273 (-),score=43.33 TRINITY_DN7594_c0_g1_i8:247-1065(-)